MQSENHRTQSADLDNYIKLQPVQQFELIYRNISVIATINVADQEAKRDPKCWHNICQPKKSQFKTILKRCSGKFSPGTFTAIVGPSGCGKTTMLNLLSGRLLPASNLEMFGYLSVNGVEVESLNEVKEAVGYVQQSDVMIPTFTPKQSFRFIADMRLPHRTTQQKQQIVASVIKSLGLRKCQDTLIGNDLIRGISGGQKKRTSIGLQLLVNPSILFLDQPTTGLDSTTALHLIQLLKALANSGRTVVSTIHQPSSQIFLQFDRLLLMVAGNIVYNDQTLMSMNYFKQLDMPVPLHSNPLDHYMRIMNKQGIELKYFANGIKYTPQQIKNQFQAILNKLVNNYQVSRPKLTHEHQTPMSNTQSLRASWPAQFCYLMRRNAISEVRNILGLLVKLIQGLIYAIFTIILFEKRAKNFNAFDQNVKGQVFFLVMVMGFSGVFSAVNTFAFQRPVFIREKINNTYYLTSYFFARVVASLPAYLLVPIITISIAYWPTILEKDVGTFFLTMLALVLIQWMGVSYGFLLSSVFADPVIVTSMIPVVIIPLMLVAGFFTPLNQVFDIFRPFEYVSLFKYGYQSLIQIQYRNGAQWGGYDKTPSNILGQQQYNFDQPLWLSLLLLFVWGIVLNLISLFALWWLSNPSSVILKKPQNPQVRVISQIKLRTKQDFQPNYL